MWPLCLISRKNSKNSGVTSTIATRNNEGIIAGAIEACDIVLDTHGPGKRLVAISPSGKPGHELVMPFPTGDGATVAMNVKLEDPIMAIGADWALEAAMKTAKEAGDNTTWTCAILKGILSGANGKWDRKFITELEEAAKVAVSLIKEKSIKVETLEQLTMIATTSANNDPVIGSLVADLIWKVGKDGTMFAMTSDTGESYSELKKGYVIRPGLMDEKFARGHRDETFNDPVVCVVDDVISSVDVLEPIYRKFRDTYAKTGVYERSMVMFVREMTGDALASSVGLRLKGVPIVVVKANGGRFRTDVLSDIAAMSGATIWSKDLGRPIEKFPKGSMNNRFQDGFGELDSVIFNASEVVAFGSVKDEYLDGVLEERFDEPEREQLRLERYSKMKNGVGYLYVGGHGNSSVTNNLQFVDDAKGACFGSLSDGYIYGGAATLTEVADDLPATDGGLLLRSAIWDGFSRMQANSGIESAEQRPGHVFNMVTERYEPYSETKVLDSAKAAACAITNAVSVATIIIKTGSSLVWQTK